MVWEISFLCFPCSSDLTIWHWDRCSPGIWNMATELTPQQLISQSAQATADAIASALTAPTASISLPIYNWHSKDAYHSFSIFQCTLENWVLLNCIATDSEDHLWYIFAALGTKALEMHAHWVPTGDEEEWKATKVKAFTFLDKIQQGMTHDVYTHAWLGELEDVIAKPGEDPQDLVACIKTLMDHCEMINDEHQDHELCQNIVHAYCHEGKLLDKLMAISFKTPSSKLTDIAVNHFAIKQAQEQVSHSSKPVDAIWHDKCQGACTSHDGDGHTPPVPPRDCPNCTWQHPTSRTNCPVRDSRCSKCNTIGHRGPKCHGVKPPLPRNAPLTWSQHGKSRCPPGSHSCSPGRGGKTDAIDVGEDHSPQDEIVLYGIQADVTTVATTHTKVNTEEAPTYDELLINAVNCGTAGGTHPGKIV